MPKMVPFQFCWPPPANAASPIEMSMPLAPKPGRRITAADSHSYLALEARDRLTYGPTDFAYDRWTFRNKDRR